MGWPTGDAGVVDQRMSTRQVFAGRIDTTAQLRVAAGLLALGFKQIAEMV